MQCAQVVRGREKVKIGGSREGGGRLELSWIWKRIGHSLIAFLLLLLIVFPFQNFS